MLWESVVYIHFIFICLFILYSLSKSLPSNHTMICAIHCSGVQKSELDKITCTKSFYLLIRETTHMLDIFCCFSRSLIHLLHSVLWLTKFTFNELQYLFSILINILSSNMNLYAFSYINIKLCPQGLFICIPIDIFNLFFSSVLNFTSYIPLPLWFIVVAIAIEVILPSPLKKNPVNFADKNLINFILCQFLINNFKYIFAIINMFTISTWNI